MLNYRDYTLAIVLSDVMTGSWRSSFYHKTFLTIVVYTCKPDLHFGVWPIIDHRNRCRYRSIDLLSWVGGSALKWPRRTSSRSSCFHRTATRTSASTWTTSRRRVAASPTRTRPTRKRSVSGGGSTSASSGNCTGYCLRAWPLGEGGPKAGWRRAASSSERR